MNTNLSQHALGRSIIGAAIVGGIAVLAAASANATTVVHKQMSLPADVITTVSGGCTNQGSTVTLGPEIILQDIPAKVVFDGGGTHDYDGIQTVNINIDLGGSITLPKQPARSGVTGNPWISVYVGDLLVVGPVRCNKL